MPTPELAVAGWGLIELTIGARDDLSPQERQIAGLARDGMSNPEIGARLFLTREPWSGTSATYLPSSVSALGGNWQQSCLGPTRSRPDGGAAS